MNHKTIHAFYAELVKQEKEKALYPLPELPEKTERKSYKLPLQITLAAMLAVAITGLVLLPLPRPGLTVYQKSTEQFDLISFRIVLAATSRSLSGEIACQRSLP